MAARAHDDYLRYATDLTPEERALVELLQEDGRMPFVALARVLGSNERTVRARVHQLLERGVIQIAAVTDPAVLGYERSALIGVELDGSRDARDVAREATRLDPVDYVVVASGRFPLYVEVLCRDQAELVDVVERGLRPLPGVRSLEVFPYLSVSYQQAGFARARDKGPEAYGVRPAELEPVDRALVRELSLDGRATFQRLGETLQISEAQARHRVKRLQESGVAQVIALVNPMGLEYRTMAWLAVRAAPAVPVAELAEAFARLPFVTYVAICAGRFDCFVEVVCMSPAELARLLDEEVRPLPGLAQLEVAVYLDLHYKRLRPAFASGERAALASGDRAA